MYSWYPVSRDDIHSNSTGLKAHCRGDEQLIDHCQWSDPAWHHCDHFLGIDCGGESFSSLFIDLFLFFLIFSFKTFSDWCNNFLPDCSNSFQLTGDRRVKISSPGFPVYIPLVTCEWNITLPPEYNASITSYQWFPTIKSFLFDADIRVGE